MSTKALSARDSNSDSQKRTACLNQRNSRQSEVLKDIYAENDVKISIIENKQFCKQLTKFRSISIALGLVSPMSTM